MTDSSNQLLNLLIDRLQNCKGQEGRILVLLFRLIEQEKENSVQISYKDIGVELGGISDSTVYRNVQKLVEKKYIKIQRTGKESRFSMRFPKPRPQKTIKKKGRNIRMKKRIRK